MTKNQTKITAESGKQEVVITREFNASRELVFKAFIDPMLYSQWQLGPKRLHFKMILDKFDPQNGGKYRYMHKSPDGHEYAFQGIYHEVFPPERIISTFEFEGQPEKGHVSLQTFIFKEISGKRTHLTLKVVFQSVADRDAMLQSGMGEGINDSYDVLEELIVDGSED